MKCVWAILLAAGLVAGCSGRQPPATAVAPLETHAGLVVAADGSVLLPAVESIGADRSRQGVILRARGVAPTQGFWGGALVSSGTPAETGVETVALRAFPPAEPHPAGAPRTRVLAVARFYSNAEMAGIRSFRVTAGQNTLSIAAPPPLPAPPPEPAS